ncbi:hypothetical protein E2C01_039951 [Portunus trituberculatus]|uniref:Uncharacterized protein n=1 Tax=Portunus trituberculatus TaxID=210409 RepID=A0A5B7FLK0_PORTR|nr:hypothetical protein [Portunus trituberculatus]
MTRFHIHCFYYMTVVINPFCTITRFYIHSGYYLVIFYSFKNSCRGLK